MHIKFRSAIFAAGFTLPMLPLPSLGQATENASMLEEVVVTAQRREERLMDVPISITVVSGEALNETAAKNLTELQGVVPGVLFTGNVSYGGSPMTIRGTTGSGGSFSDDPVALYVDNIYFPSGAFSSSMLVDIGSIEVVRGPQGTLQGRNATAGAVIVRTADPQKELGGYARASIADPTEYRLETAITGSLTDTLSARAAFNYYDEEGWADNTFNGTKLASGDGILGRVTLLWEPVDNARVRLATTYSELDVAPALTRWAQTPISPAPGPAVTNPTPEMPLTQAEQDRIKDDQYALNRSTESRSRTIASALEASYDLGNIQLVSVTGWSQNETRGDNDSDGLALTDREGYNNGVFDYKTFTQEVRLQSNTRDSLSWILGAYYSNTKQDMLFNIYNVSFTQGGFIYTTFVSHQENPSYAGFADATFKLNEQWSLTGGVRYTDEDKRFNFDRNTYAIATNALVPGSSVTYQPEADWNDVSYRAKATFTPRQDLMLYASYSKGFKSGGFNAFGNEPAFNPEELFSAELGVKAGFERGSITASVYSNKYDNLQIRAGVATGGIAVTNAADSRIDGTEIEGRYEFTEKFSIDANVAYTDARFTRFPAARNLRDTAYVDASGNKLPRTPKWQYFLQASHRMNAGANMDTLFQVSYRWRDIVYFYHTDQDAPTIQGEATGELGARASFIYKPMDITLALFGTNLTNERVVNGMNINFAYPEVSFNRPRTIGLQVEKKF